MIDAYAGFVRQIVINEHVDSGSLTVTTRDLSAKVDPTAGSESGPGATASLPQSDHGAETNDSKGVVRLTENTSDNIPDLPEDALLLIAELSDLHTLLAFSTVSRAFYATAGNPLQNSKSPQNLDILNHRIRNLAKRKSDFATTINRLADNQAPDSKVKYSIVCEASSLQALATFHAVRRATGLKGKTVHLRILMDLESQFGFLRYGAAAVHLDRLRTRLAQARQEGGDVRGVRLTESEDEVLGLARRSLGILVDTEQLLHESHGAVLDRLIPRMQDAMTALPLDLREFDATNPDQLHKVLKFCKTFFEQIETACQGKNVRSDIMRQVGREANAILFTVSGCITQLTQNWFELLDPNMASADISFFSVFDSQQVPLRGPSDGQLIDLYHTDNSSVRTPLVFEQLAEHLDSPENRLAEKSVLLREFLLAINEARQSAIQRPFGKDFNVPYRLSQRIGIQIAHSLLWPQGRNNGGPVSSTKPWFTNGQPNAVRPEKPSALPDSLSREAQFKDWARASRESKRVAEFQSTPSPSSSSLQSGTPGSSSSGSSSAFNSLSVSSSSLMGSTSSRLDSVSRFPSPDSQSQFRSTPSFSSDGSAGSPSGSGSSFDSGSLSSSRSGS